MTAEIEALKKRRMAAGVSQEALAREAGISRNSVQAAEKTGNCLPRNVKAMQRAMRLIETRQRAEAGAFPS
jgi:DNA-binding XRE family transcriptional regulator